MKIHKKSYLKNEIKNWTLSSNYVDMLVKLYFDKKN